MNLSTHNCSLQFVVSWALPASLLERFHDQLDVAFPVGAITWIAGCLFYLVPLTILILIPCGGDYKWPLNLGEEIGEFICLFFIFGCSFVSFGGKNGMANEDQVLSHLPIKNAFFFIGSLALLSNPLWLVVSCQIKPLLFGCQVDATITTINWWFEFLVGISFSFAGVVGGYGK